jgi:hypothetical protein
MYSWWKLYNKINILELNTMLKSLNFTVACLRKARNNFDHHDLIQILRGT